MEKLKRRRGLVVGEAAVDERGRAVKLTMTVR